MEKKQIDKLLGGLYDLSGRVTLMEFISARAPELAALNQAIENASKNKPLDSTNLPMHMRRSLMSHNQNRLPRRVLEAIKKERTKKLASKRVHNITKSRRKQKKKRGGKSPTEKNSQEK